MSAWLWLRKRTTASATGRPDRSSEGEGLSGAGVRVGSCSRGALEWRRAAARALVVPAGWRTCVISQAAGRAAWGKAGTILAVGCAVVGRLPQPSPVMKMVEDGMTDLALLL